MCVTEKGVTSISSIFKGTKDDLHGPKKAKLLLFMFTNFQWTSFALTEGSLLLFFGLETLKPVRD